MLKDTNSFKDITSFIEHLKKKKDIVGIVEYGGRTHTDMSIGGDYDLTVIFNKPVSNNFSGVHFHIAGIPVDCMILSVGDFETDTPSNPFLFVHLNCTILFDRDDITKNLLKRIKTTWKVPEDLSDFENNMFRFISKHIIDKLEHRLHENQLYSKYFIFSSFDWYLECYARINNLEVGKPKTHLNYIKNNDFELFKIINKLYSTNDLDIQFEMLKKCANHVVLSIGGLWENDEVLFHMTPGGKNIDEEQEKFIKQLFE
ncbi:hypothetical protein [Oceanirhabdus sp. W0125-5]|uniref:hypothetical protein n=1 Tax=Oceanirhabdus sp. W0125-5 TaxID=2999116 RepID=UPI0022F2ECD6|nr:hypothetical protein [Oceanirhabdus sp. W0125-5]WBW97069.1 hypothetical protein OW730_25765 [Oceanirhabdus sp. W0125-5]